MKKVLLLFLLACVMAPVGAQVYIGGSVSAWLDDNNGKETSTVSFLPELGFLLGERWAVGAVLGYSQRRYDGTTTSETFEFSPYARFTYYRTDLVGLFIDGTVSTYSSKSGSADRVATYSVGLKPGVSFDLSDRISLVAKFGFFGFRQYSDDNTGIGFNLNGNDLSLGLYYTF